MGEQHGLTHGTTGDPSWATVAVTTWRLWLERHTNRGRRAASRRRRGILVLSAVAAMALGALVTLAVTQPESPQASKTASSQPQSANPAQNTPAALQFSVNLGNREDDSSALTLVDLGLDGGGGG